MALQRRSAAGPTRLLLIVTLTVLAIACGFRKAPRTSTQGGAPADVMRAARQSAISRPGSLTVRAWFALAPDPSVPYELVAIDDSGYSPGTTSATLAAPSGASSWESKRSPRWSRRACSGRWGVPSAGDVSRTKWQLTGKQVETGSRSIPSRVRRPESCRRLVLV